MFGGNGLTDLALVIIAILALGAAVALAVVFL